MGHAATRIAAATLLGLFALLPQSARAQAPSADAEIIFNSGLIHLREGRAPEALEEFKKAVRKDPKSPYFQKGLGLAYLKLNDPKSAIDAFRRALELNPYYVDVRNDLGAALAQAGKRDDAKKEFLAAYNDPMNPTPETSARNLGQAYFEEKRYDEALNWCRTSATRNNHYPDAYLCIADVLVAGGKLDEAVAQLEIGAKSLPEDVTLALALGDAYYRAGRFSDARVKLELVAGKDPAGPSGRRAAELLRNFPK